MDLVDRLHDRLRAAAPAPTGFTIGELYQRLIPYRSVRGELGVWELAEYEHALLRLLSGERDYLELEDPSARAEIARELASPNPILGVYRDYPAARVRLGAASTGAGAAPVDAALESPPAPPALPRASGPAEAPPAPVPPALCRACHAPLPDAPDLRFCPACGAGQGEQPCAKCGAALRPEWRFCIHCGERRGR